MKTLHELNSIWLSFDDVHFDIKYFKPLIPLINNYLLQHNQIRGSLLDFGCGHGSKTKVFHKMGYRVCGLDKDINLINRAKAELPDIEFKHLFVEGTLPYEDNSFEVIFSASVFQYMKNHQQILNEFKRILKPGGCIILAENLKNNPFTRAGRIYLKYKKLKYQSYPFNHFTYHEFSDLKKQFDYSQTAYFHLFTPLAQHWIGRKYYNLFEKIDFLLLKMLPFKWIAWIGFFGGVSRK